MQNLRTAYDQLYEKKFEEKLRGLKILNRRCNINYNVVEACWRFEGILTDPDYVLSRMEILLGLTKDPLTISRFVLDSQDVALGIDTFNWTNYVVCGETIVLHSFKHSVGIFLHQRTWNSKHTLEEIAQGFQRMCEWFTIQTSAYKAMEQGHIALTNHHRFADADTKFAEGKNLILQSLSYPPMIQ